MWIWRRWELTLKSKQLLNKLYVGIANCCNQYLNLNMLNFIKYGLLMLFVTMISCKNENKNITSDNSRPIDSIDFLKRTPSFSYVFFKGNCVESVLSFLAKVDYKLLTRETLTGDYVSVYKDIETISDDNTIVKKGLFFKDGYTVLIDPEMVIGTQEKELVELSKEIDNPIVVAIWERYSQTRAFIRITKNGLESRTYLTEGQDAVDNINPNKHLEKINSETGLLLALDELKIPYKTLFGDNMNLEVLTLKE